ncbi:unnamed protein product, partial [marine sediment metagenome]
YVSDPFDETPWKQSSDIVVNGESRGVVEVYYLEDCPHLDGGPFLKEERHLLDGLARVLGRAAEHKQAKEALAASNHDLTLMANRLEQANRELTDFVYVASHDLREPLRKIASFGTLLKDSLEGKLEEDDRENLHYMIDGADRMTQMIEGLLIYSRLNTGSDPFDVADLNETIEQLERLELAAMLEETGATIEVPQPLPKVKGEPVQLRQLLQNLITNGIKYHRDGVAPRIVISAGALDDETVKIEVRDNGIGVSEEFREDIFKMFRRLH